MPGTGEGPLQNVEVLLKATGVRGENVGKSPKVPGFVEGDRIFWGAPTGIQVGEHFKIATARQSASASHLGNVGAELVLT